jgi:hypothetical protein
MPSAIRSSSFVTLTRGQVASKGAAETESLWSKILPFIDQGITEKLLEEGRGSIRKIKSLEEQIVQLRRERSEYQKMKQDNANFQKQIGKLRNSLNIINGEKKTCEDRLEDIERILREVPKIHDRCFPKTNKDSKWNQKGSVSSN